MLQGELLEKDVRTRSGEQVGEIEDIVFDRRGKVVRVLLDIGGFLGLGEKTVAVDMIRLNFGTPDGAVFDGTRENLEGLPETGRGDAFTTPQEYSQRESRTYDPLYGAPHGYHGYYPRDQRAQKAVEPAPQPDHRNTFSGERFIGARVAGAGGTHLGRVKNLLIDPYSGWVTHAIVDTGGFWEAGRTNVRVPMDRLRPDGMTSARYLGTDREFEMLPGN